MNRSTFNFADRFGNLLYIRESISVVWGTQKRRVALFRCDCGNLKEISVNSVKSGATRSCGCLAKQIHLQMSTTHGLSGSRIYNIWNMMIQRCTNPIMISFPIYGGRGITVCEEWAAPCGVGFENFYMDMSEGYDDSLSLDRIDNSQGYYKENCKWSTRREQCTNRRLMLKNRIGKAGVAERITKKAVKYTAVIAIAKGVRKHLGTFDKLEDAIAARERAELEFYGFLTERI